MATPFASLQATGAPRRARIPMTDGSHVRVTTETLSQIVAGMSVVDSAAMYRAARQGDVATAQRLLREAAAAYQAAAPAEIKAPAPTPPRAPRVR
jgi:hypothetical protein